MNNNNESIGLRVLSVSPSHTESNVNVNSSIDVTFSSDINPITLSKNIVVFEDYNKQVGSGNVDGQNNYTFGPEAEKAMKLMDEGNNLFITGKAGTGKTTLLQEILKRNQNAKKKNIVVLAPTGVAAENAGGMTMHHFLRIPMKPYLPDHTVLPTLYKLEPGTEEVVRNLDVLIIDEVSMVRCDQLDAIDMILKHYRKNRIIQQREAVCHRHGVSDDQHQYHSLRRYFFP